MGVKDEFALIRLLNRPRQAEPAAGSGESGVVVGIGDDAAVLRPNDGVDLVVTCDTMVESTHFKPETMTHADIGYKAMTSNLSDIAAMGGVPRWAVVALAVPKGYSPEALLELYDGLYACASRYDTAVVGGDTTLSPAGLTITVTVIGEASRGRALLRSSAKPGDAVFVTGPLGDSAAGLHALLARGEPAGGTELLPESVRSLAQAHRRPEPRLAAGRLLAASELEGRLSLNDISDGLASEAWELAEMSGVRIRLYRERIPISAALVDYAASVGVDPLEWALYGGEDYELVGTARPEAAEGLSRMFAQSGMSLYWIGEVLEAEAEDANDQGGVGVLLETADGCETPIGKKGYNHFA